MKVLRGKKKRKDLPSNATAWCALHERLMNDLYIRQIICSDGLGEVET